jgi:polar amino acid transport system substrate-binding protein
MTRKTFLVIFIFFIVSILLLTACRRGTPNEISTPEDVAGKVIGALSGTPSVRMADELGTARAFDSLDEMMEQLRSGEFACVIMESTTASELVANTSGVRILSEPLEEYDLRFAVPKENAQLLAAVNTALEALEQNGTLRGLSNKYFAGRNFVYEPPEGVAARSGHLTVALPPDSPPFSFKDEEGRFIGMDVEVARAVCDFLGVELRVIEYDAWELVTAVWYGRADLALGWRPGEGEELINTSEAYANAVHVVIVRR